MYFPSEKILEKEFDLVTDMKRAFPAFKSFNIYCVPSYADYKEYLSQVIEYKLSKI
jgi:hypothetical protein